MRLAATASPIAQIHHAIGCTVRGKRRAAALAHAGRRRRARIVSSPPAPTSTTSTTVSAAGNGDPEPLPGTRAAPRRVRRLLASCSRQARVVAGGGGRVVAGTVRIGAGSGTGGCEVVAVTVGGGAIGGATCTAIGATVVRAALVVVVVLATSTAEGAMPGLAELPNVNATIEPGAGS